MRFVVESTATKQFHFTEAEEWPRAHTRTTKGLDGHRARLLWPLSRNSGTGVRACAVDVVMI